MAKQSLLTRVRNHFAKTEHPEALQSTRIRRQLQSAVLDAMAGAGILSAHYRFKVLTLLGDQTSLVLVFNLENPLAGGLQQAAGLELRIRLLAQARFGLHVHAVYWRVDSLVRIAEPRPAPVAPVASVVPVAASPKARTTTTSEFAETQPWAPTVATGAYSDEDDSDHVAQPAASDLIGLYDLPRR